MISVATPTAIPATEIVEINEMNFESFFEKVNFLETKREKNIFVIFK
jgi:hypothetical protein